MSFFDRILQSLKDFFKRDDGIDEPEEDIEGWYMSGLGYGRDVGAIIYDVTETEAEDILREYLEKNAGSYNPDFYGLGEIDYDGFSPLDTVIEVNL